MHRVDRAAVVEKRFERRGARLRGEMTAERRREIDDLLPALRFAPWGLPAPYRSAARLRQEDRSRGTRRRR